MEKDLEVSVIMAEYNTDENLLLEAIHSILNQTYKNFEFIIIDDCGKNDVSKIVESINDDRIVVYKNEKNMGLVYSLNKAVNLAKGKYIVRMDTDDFSYKDRLEKQVKFIKEHEEYSIVSMNADIYNGTKIVGTTKSYGPVYRKHLLKGTPYIHPTVIIRKEAVLKCGGYPDYKRCEDYALWIEMFCRNYKGYIMNDVGIRYTLRPTDYNKRTLSTRKGTFRLLKGQYYKLKPRFYNYMYMYSKTFLSGIIPKKMMILYHNRKFSK